MAAGVEVMMCVEEVRKFKKVIVSIKEGVIKTHFHFVLHG